jgi:hypothetical protein
VIVSGLTGADTASQIPPGRADDPSRRQTELNVSIIRPMKKILTTLTVIAATALGVQGQTINVPNTGTGSLTNLTFTLGTFNPAIAPYNRAKLLFAANGLSAGASITISGMTLTGDGITTPPTFPDVTISSNLDPEDPVFTITSRRTISSVSSWNTANSRLSFNYQVNNGSLSIGSNIFYRLEYSDIDNFNVNTTVGNLSIVAVPEPSTYAAAAGLLALFLWSSRRHLFKLAGARSSASGPGENGAA